MKKALLFVLALIAAGCAEPIPRNLDDLSRQGPQYVDPETLEPYRGPAYRMPEDDSTQIVLKVNLRDGRSHGDFEDFEPDNVEDSLGLYQTGTYRDGQREGPYEIFYPSGVLIGRGTYENDLKEGPYESYYENGEPRNRINYVAGELDGPYEIYYENGQLSGKTTYAAGERDGPFERYYENGQLQSKGTYVADEVDQRLRTSQKHYPKRYGGLGGEALARAIHEDFYKPNATGFVDAQGVRQGGLPEGSSGMSYEQFVERMQNSSPDSSEDRSRLLDGPYESYSENGQWQQKGVWNMGGACGEWIEDGETVTYDPCPPDLADGN